MINNQFLICLLLLVFSTSAKQQWIQYEVNPQQSLLLQKYFHGIAEGYFLQLGGFNPIQSSTTVKLSNWKGLIVQANEQRANYIRDFQNIGITALNFALTNVSGTLATFYQTNEPQYSSLIKGKQAVQRQAKAITISLADLCHKYYKARPTFMRIDLDGIVQSTLKSNDWALNKCIPEVIYATEHATQVEGSTEKYLTSLEYTKVESLGNNKLFIHKSRLAFYKKQALQNSQYLKNVQIVADWPIFTQSLSKLLKKPFTHQYIPSSHAAFIQIRQPSVINIVQINVYSNLISSAGLNRPIIVMQYDQQRSMIYLGSKSYAIQDVVIDNLHFKKIVYTLEGKELLVYFFDHRKTDPFKLIVLDDFESSSEIEALMWEKTNTISDILDEKANSLKMFMLDNQGQFVMTMQFGVIFTLVLTNLALVSIFMWCKKRSSRSVEGLGQRSPNSFTN